MAWAVIVLRSIDKAVGTFKTYRLSTSTIANLRLKFKRFWVQQGFLKVAGREVPGAYPPT
jgi:hypothetical protein